MLKTFFFGIDSATWDLINPWVKKGLLPGFKKLKEYGLTYNLNSTTPPLTPVAWSTLYTGKNPGKHGIFGFYYLDEEKNIKINDASNRLGEDIFEILSKNNRKIAILNFPITYPVKKNINGVMISSFMTPGLDSDFIYPKTLKRKFIEKFPDYTFNERGKYSYSKKSKLELAQEILDSVREKIKMFTWLEEQGAWDFYAINFMEVDHVQHWFWKHMDISHPNLEKNSELEKIIFKVYQEIDAYLKEVLEKNHYDLYMIFSDHGAGPYVKTVNLNSIFLKKGIIKIKRNLISQIKLILFRLGFSPNMISNLALRLNLFRDISPKADDKKKNKASFSLNKMINKLFLSFDDIDFERSLAFSFGSYGYVYLIQKNSYNKIIVFLKKITFQGKKVFKNIRIKKEVYSGKLANFAPDIVFDPMSYAFRSAVLTPFLDYRDFTEPHALKSGEHRQIGIFGIYSKNKEVLKRFDKNKKQIDIPDVTRTLLDVLDAPTPSDFEGQSLYSRSREDNLLGDLDELLK